VTVTPCDVPLIKRRNLSTLMLSSITQNWWLAALRGALAVVFGVAAFVWPGLTLEVLVLLFGAYAFVDGVVVLSFGLMAAGDHQRWWPLVLSGVVGIGTGVLVIAQPGAGALTLVYLFGFFAILAGIAQISLGFRLRGLGETLQPRTQQATSPSR
jgi:uncharacterized membrane protein HdeD (DUF308 family)